MEAEWRPRAEEHATTVSAACELSEGAEPEQRKEGGKKGTQMRPRLWSAAIMFGQFHNKK